MNDAPIKSPTPVAPLLRFSDVLGELLADARAASEARSSGQPRGPVTSFPSIDREISHALAPGLHGRRKNSLRSPSRREL
jgi:hypothetical protein